MKRLAIKGVALAACTAFATAASATTLYSGAVVLTHGNTIQCHIVNAARTPSTVNIIEFDINGVVLWSSGPQTIASGQALSDDSTLAEAEAASYCGFTISAPAKTYRAAAENTQSGVGTIAVYPAQ